LAERAREECPPRRRRKSRMRGRRREGGLRLPPGVDPRTLHKIPTSISQTCHNIYGFDTCGNVWIWNRNLSVRDRRNVARKYKAFTQIGEHISSSSSYLLYNRTEN
jgi:hypothetical protein